MRLMECLRLRVKDVDFGYRQIVLLADGERTDLGALDYQQAAA